MKKIIAFLYVLATAHVTFSQNVGIGNVVPVAKLTVIGASSAPSIPGFTSTGVLRVGISGNEAIDFGKLSLPPFSGWIQAGYDGEDTDPISLQAIGGNVGIGTTTPTVKLEVAGDVKVSGKVTNVTNPTAPQDAATKAYVGFLEDQLFTLEGLKDIDNNRYDVVNIGSQFWMADNLRVTRYNDGTPIAQVVNAASWSGLTTAAYTWYNNDASDYGALYNFYTVAETNPLNVCPLGWHVPTIDEIATLVDVLQVLPGFEGSAKEAGLAHWDSPNTFASNASGLALLPSGYRQANGSFGGIGTRAWLWTSELYDPSTALFYWVSNTDFLFYYNGLASLTEGAAVRCLKD